MKKFRLILLISVLSILAGSCGTRNTKLRKELQEAQLYASFLERQQSVFEIKAREQSKARSEEEVAESTTIKEYALDPNGKPFVQKETTTNSKGNKKTEQSAEKATDVKHAEKKQSSGSIDASAKEELKDKETEADKTFVTNLGGWGVLIVVIILFLVYLYFARKK